VVRFPGKRFLQRRPDSSDPSGYVWNLRGVRRVLYRLPDVMRAVEVDGATVYVVEGEKDVHAIERAGGIATCNPGGAGKWRDEYAETLRQGNVVVVADRDEPGAAHAAQVVESLEGIADTVRIVGPREGKDAAEHLAAGHGLEDFVPLDELPEAPPIDVDTGAAAHSWRPIDLLKIETAPLEPAVIGGLVYPGRRHVFSGEPESLKTWAALVLSAKELRAGRAAVVVDFETGARGMLERLRDLGLTDEELARFLFLAPSEPLSDPSVRRDVEELLREQRPSLVVVDAFTGALEIHGLDPNSGVEVERFYRTIVGPFQAHGAAVVLLDHLAKSKETRGKFSIGSERKLGGADVHLGFDVVRPFGRGKSGLAKITTHKDRPGYLPRPKAAELELWSDAETGLVTFEIRLADPLDDEHDFRPTVLMERVSRYLEQQTVPVKRATIDEDVSGNRQYKLKAINTLIREGYADENTDGGIASEKAFREAADDA
jgi:hypothetical protein